MSVYDEDTCSGLYKYMGDMVDNILKLIGLQPGTCPIPKGVYSLTDYYLDLSMIPYSMVPQGIIQNIFVITDNNTKKVLLCYESEIENLPS